MAELRRLATEDPVQRAAAERLLARMFETRLNETGKEEGEP